MKPRLQIVLDLRLGAEDAAKRALGALEYERAGIVAERAGLERALRSAAETPVIAMLREQLSAYAAAARDAAAGCDRRLAEQDKRIATARDAVAVAHRAVRAIAALQERDRAALRHRAQRQEGRACDEFAALMHVEAAI